MNKYISRISSVEIPVSNLEDSIKWYTQVFGLEIQFQDKNSAMLTFDAIGVPGIFLCETKDNSRLHFVNSNTEITHSVIDFYTSDLKGFHSHLIQQGIEVGALNMNTEYDVGGFGIKDPDGNMLGVCNAIQQGQV